MERKNRVRKGVPAPADPVPLTPTLARNRAYILDVAYQVWMHQPDASLETIAQAAGVTRRTLYSHFANRDVLVGAVANYVGDVLVQLGDEAQLSSGSASENLTRIALRLVSLAREMRLLLAMVRQLDGALDEPLARVDAAITRVIAQGQRAGEFSRHLPPEVFAHVVGAQAMALDEAFSQGSWDGSPQDAAMTTLLTLGVSPAKAAKLVERQAPPPK